MNSMRGVLARVRRLGGSLIVLGALVCVAQPLSGQDGRPGRRGDVSPQERAELEQRVRAQMARMMQERLELSEGVTAQLSAVVQQFHERRRALGRSELATRRRVEALMLEGGEDEVEAQQLLDRMRDLQRQESALFEEELNALLEVLPPTKVLQFQTLREQMGRRIRSLGRGNGDRGGRRGNVDGLRGVPLLL
jgi:Spy/CpxP family protein refolding chaperone